MNISQSEALDKLRKYCAYQERCHKEVKEKLAEIGIRNYDEQNEITDALIREKYLDEERFARAFARGKFRIKHWGRDKIKRELKLRDISPYCTEAAMSEIDEEDYRESLMKILLKKYQELRTVKPEPLRKKKTVMFAVSKGYESNLAWNLVNEPEFQA